MPSWRLPGRSARPSPCCPRPPRQADRHRSAGRDGLRTSSRRKTHRRRQPRYRAIRTGCPDALTQHRCDRPRARPVTRATRLLITHCASLPPDRPMTGKPDQLRLRRGQSSWHGRRAAHRSADLRPTARALVVDPAGRLLMFGGTVGADDKPGRTWFAPGGGVRPGESLTRAAVRELAGEAAYSSVPSSLVRSSRSLRASGGRDRARSSASTPTFSSGPHRTTSMSMQRGTRNTSEPRWPHIDGGRPLNWIRLPTGSFRMAQRTWLTDHLERPLSGRHRLRWREHRTRARTDR